MKTLILAIDIQNEYINPEGVFNIRGIKNSLDNAKLIIDAARMRNIPLWHIKHEQDKNVFSRQ